MAGAGQISATSPWIRTDSCSTQKLDGQILHREPKQVVFSSRGRGLKPSFQELCLFNGLKRSLVFFLIAGGIPLHVQDPPDIPLYFLFIGCTRPGLTVLINFLDDAVD